MAVYAENIDWVLSGGASNSDPNASLGGARSTVKQVQLFQSALTANQGDARHRFVDSAKSGAGDGYYAGDYVIFIGRPATPGAGNEIVAFRIVDYISATGEFELAGETPIEGLTGDLYRLHPLECLFDDVSALECSNADVEYRMIFCRNMGSGAGTVDDAKMYVRPLDLGDAELAIASDDNHSGSPIPPTIGDEGTEPDISTFAHGGHWSRPLSYGQSSQPAPGHWLVDGGSRPVWIRRTIPLHARRRSSAVGMVIFEGPQQAAPYDLIRCGCLIPFDIAGFTPAMDVYQDRRVFINGGCRVFADVTAQETGAPVEDVDVGWELDPPTDGSMAIPPEDSITDEDGQAFVSYTAPTDPAKDGDTVDIEANI